MTTPKLHPEAVRAAERMYMKPEPQVAQVISAAIDEHLKSEGYDDPKYLYAGKRIERAAIECRNKEIHQLLEEKRLMSELHGCECDFKDGKLIAECGFHHLREEGWEELREAAFEMSAAGIRSGVLSPRLLRALHRVQSEKP